MSTSKRKRKYAQDFSGGSLTDTSFAPACDVNRIVRHYESTGVDPYQDRKKTARFEDATVLSYEDAMRNAAELNSKFANLPTQEQLEHGNSVHAWLESLTTPPTPTERLRDAEDLSIDPPAKPAPQDASGGE